MKTTLTHKEANEKIDSFFKRENFELNELRKIKKLGMAFNICLGEKRKLFCKKCLSKLNGRTRVSKVYKTIVCESCGFLIG